RPSARRGGWCLVVLSRSQKYFLSLWVEGHCLRARLSLHSAGIFEIISRFFVKDVQDTFAAREENQLCLRVETRVVHASADRKAIDDLARRPVHDHHLRLVATADEQSLSFRIVSDTGRRFR